MNPVPIQHAPVKHIAQNSKPQLPPSVALVLMLSLRLIRSGAQALTGGDMERKSHWEEVYRSKAPSDVSWYQPRAKRSLELIQKVAPDSAASIIDVGGCRRWSVRSR